MVCYLSSQAPVRESGQKKISYIIRGEGIKKKYLGKKIKIP